MYNSSSTLCKSCILVHRKNKFSFIKVLCARRGKLKVQKWKITALTLTAPSHTAFLLHFPHNPKAQRRRCSKPVQLCLNFWVTATVLVRSELFPSTSRLPPSHLRLVTRNSLENFFADSFSRDNCDDERSRSRWKVLHSGLHFWLLLPLHPLSVREKFLVRPTHERKKYFCLVFRLFSPSRSTRFAFFPLLSLRWKRFVYQRVQALCGFLFLFFRCTHNIASMQFCCCVVYAAEMYGWIFSLAFFSFSSFFLYFCDANTNTMCTGGKPHPLAIGLVGSIAKKRRRRMELKRRRKKGPNQLRRSFFRALLTRLGS